MTRNYLTYMANLEQERSNKAVEKETNRHNVVTEKEVNRHNVAVESETNRHNLVVEEQGWQALAETSRHNYAIEAVQGGQLELGYAQLYEQARHNKAYEVIQTIGANAAASQAVSSQIQAAAAKLNAQTNATNAEINQQNADTRWSEHNLDLLKQAETERHNKAMEDYNTAVLEHEKVMGWSEATRNYTQSLRNIGGAVGDALDVITSLKFAN